MLKKLRLFVIISVDTPNWKQEMWAFYPDIKYMITWKIAWALVQIKFVILINDRT